MTPDDRCQQLAAQRFGVFTREEALALGLNARQLRHRVKNGRLEEMFPGIYRHPASPRTWEQKVCAAQAWAGNASAASGRTAAALWDLIATAPDSIEITCPRPLRSPDPSTTLDRLSAFLQARGRRGRGGTAPLRTLLVQLGETPGTDRFERLLFAALVARSLPKPVSQHPVRLDGKTYYLDFAYPEARLGIEAHSFKHHSEREDWESDQVRHARLTAEGWTILYVTWRRLRDHPDLVARDISRTLGRSARPDDQRLVF